MRTAEGQSATGRPREAGATRQVYSSPGNDALRAAVHSAHRQGLAVVGLLLGTDGFEVLEEPWASRALLDLGPHKLTVLPAC